MIGVVVVVSGRSYSDCFVDQYRDIMAVVMIYLTCHEVEHSRIKMKIKRLSVEGKTFCCAMVVTRFIDYINEKKFYIR